MSTETRPYRKQRRAELELETRRRITESAMELHGTLGPTRTSMSAIAEHAGVRRSTLYRHFPDEAAVFAACSAHWYERNPVPDLGQWSAIADPSQRLRRGLDELYAYYGRNEQMLANLLRDEDAVPVVREHFGEFHGYLDAARDTLLTGLAGAAAERRRAKAAVGHAVAFTTWRSLVREQGLGRRAAVDLMCRWVESAAGAHP